MKGTARGIFAGFLGLIALHAVGTKGGSGRVAEAFTDVAQLVERALDPDVPAIPDRRRGAAQPAPEPSTTDTTGQPPRLPVPAPPTN